MKKVILACLLMVSASAFAWGHYGYRGGYYHGYGWGGWVAPAVVGGVIGYSLATPPVYAAPPVVYSQPPVVVQQPVQPVQITPQPNCSAWTEIRNPDGTITTQRICQ
jgi:hypothetical protein